MTHRMNILQSPMVCAHRVTRGVKSRALFAVVILVGQGSLASAQTKPSASSLQLGQITCAAGRSQEEMWNTNTPERMPLTDDYQHQNIAEETTSWCIAETNETNLYVAFRVDTESNDGDIKPELTMLYELSESGEIARITQASRVKDQLEYVSVDHPSFNPYPVDLSNRTNDLVFEPNYGATYFAGSPSIKDRLLGLVAPLINTSKMKRLVRKRNIFEEGQFTSMIPEDKHPYGAYWWPHSGLPLITGDYSPLAKYDRFVRGKTGVDPMSRKWESDNHSLQHVEWGGHCNGWAASSILHKEATTIKWSREINHVILPSDFNGMLAEASFCVDLAFYGHRYNGTAGEDLKDISPEKFHQVLLYYIDQIKKPIATDYVQGVSVDNHVIVGYDMTITKDATLPNTYNVINELSMYGYDVNRNEVIGKSTESYTRRFTYQLTTDDTGNVISGNWTSQNPDFLWVPLAQKKCGRENPKIDHKIIVNAMATLPDAAADVVPTPSLAFRGEMGPSQAVYIYPKPSRGGLLTEVAFNEFSAPAGVTVMLSCIATYPKDGKTSLELRIRPIGSSFAQKVKNECLDVEYLKISNESTKLRDVAVSVAGFSYLGKP